MRTTRGKLRDLLARPALSQAAEESALAAIIRSSQDAVIGKALDGTITAWNAGATLVYGHNAEHVLGQNIEQMFPADAVDEERIRHGRVAAGFAESGYRCRRLRSDGSEIEVVMSMAPVRDYRGRVVGVATISRPVTDQEGAESRYASLLDASPDGMIGSDRHGRITMANAQIIALLGYSRQELVGSPIELLLPESDRQGHLLHQQDYLKNPRTRQMGVGRALKARRRDGTTFPVEISLSADGTGDDLIILAAIRDVTQQREIEKAASREDVIERVRAALAFSEAEAAVRAANEAKSAFLSRMNHELRTPLNAVLGFGQLLERGKADPDSLVLIRHILKAGRHLLELINEVLDVGRIASGELSVSLEPLPARAMIEETVALVQSLADAEGVSVHIEVGHSTPAVLADRQRLRQVLLNLLSNSIKYNHQDGNVWISWTTAAGDSSITVRDDGRGIAPELQSRLFTPFDRLDAESTGVEGTGVGLSVTRSLVRLMNGSMTYQSSPGVGSSFTVTLPAAPPVPEDRTPERHLPPSSPVEDRPPTTATVLYIEDVGPNVRVIEAMMRLRPGWRLLHSGTGGVGIQLAGLHQPDLVLLDLELPDHSGRDVLAELNNNPATADIPVVVMSSDATSLQQDRLFDAGVTRYLDKPVDLKVLLGLLDELAAVKAGRLVLEVLEPASIALNEISDNQ